MSLRSVLWGLRCWPVLRTGVLERFYTALGSPDALGLRGVPLPCLARLLMVGSLGDVRRRVDVSVVGNVA